MPSPESDAIGFNSEILFQALNATPFVLVDSMPRGKRGEVGSSPTRSEDGFNVAPCIGRCLIAQSKQKLPNSWSKWQEMPFVGSTPTLEVDAAFIVRLVERQTRSLEVAVSKDVKVQVLYRTP